MARTMKKATRKGRNVGKKMDRDNETRFEDKENKVEFEEAAPPVTPQKKSPQSQPATATKPPSRSSFLIEDKDNRSLNESSYVMNPKTLFEAEARVKKVYKIVQKCTGALGGNGYNGAIYGELTLSSMQKVIDFMVENCSMGPASRFIDVGSGLGKPNFHASQDPGVKVSIGIELEEIRWQLAIQNLRGVLKAIGGDRKNGDDVTLLSGVNFVHGDIFDVITTDPFTHIYMYDLGFPPTLQKKIAEYFNASTHAQYLVSYRPARRVISEYGYNVVEIGKLPTSMTGSGEVHTAYFYKRFNEAAPCTERPGTSLISVPNGNSTDKVVCSDFFRPSVLHALGPVPSLTMHVEQLSKNILGSGRPKRERKPRVL